MTTAEHHLKLQPAAEIPYVNAEEAYQLLRTELDRFLDLVDNLDPEDWGKPTACSAWDVRDILAHQAGGYASGASWREMLRQGRQQPETGQLPVDAVNAFQLKEREGHTPQELIAELRQVGPIAARKWASGCLNLSPSPIPIRADFPSIT